MQRRTDPTPRHPAHEMPTLRAGMENTEGTGRARDRAHIEHDLLDQYRRGRPAGRRVSLSTAHQWLGISKQLANYYANQADARHDDGVDIAALADVLLQRSTRALK